MVRDDRLIAMVLPYESIDLRGFILDLFDSWMNFYQCCRWLWFLQVLLVLFRWNDRYGIDLRLWISVSIIWRLIERWLKWGDGTSIHHLVRFYRWIEGFFWDRLSFCSDNLWIIERFVLKYHRALRYRRYLGRNLWYRCLAIDRKISRKLFW